MQETQQEDRERGTILLPADILNNALPNFLPRRGEERRGEERVIRLMHGNHPIKTDDPLLSIQTRSQLPVEREGATELH
jgi:hypothetical protein